MVSSEEVSEDSSDEVTSDTMSAGVSDSSSESNKMTLTLEESADRALVHPCPIFSFAGAHCFGG